MSNLSYSQLNAVVKEMMQKCLRSLDEGDVPQARTAAAAAADVCRHSLNGGGAELAGSEKSRTLICGILAAACRDMSDCQQQLHSPNLADTQVETLWNRLIDCLERLEFVRMRLEAPGVEQFLSYAQNLRQRFDQRFGPGLYANPEIVIHGEICNLCNDDFRRCGHISGRVYDGVLCKRIPRQMTVRSVTVGKRAVDLRFRVWPWSWDAARRQYSFAPLMRETRMDDLSDPAMGAGEEMKESNSEEGKKQGDGGAAT